MFSGIVSTIGIISSISNQNNYKAIVCKVTSDLLRNINIGDSISVNGVCLTVTSFSKEYFSVEIIEETLVKSTLGSLKENSLVNLEGALRTGEGIGGHYVQGHVDCPAKIIDINKSDKMWRVTLALPKALSCYVIPKGFVTIDGMSLTVVDVKDHMFSIALIPHTINHTIAKDYRIGQFVNFEADMMAKYIENFLQKTRIKND